MLSFDAGEPRVVLAARAVAGEDITAVEAATTRERPVWYDRAPMERRGPSTSARRRPPRVPAGSPLGADDLRRLADGSHDRLFECLGCHAARVDETGGRAFAVWAPSGASVSVVGSWNDWRTGAAPLAPVGRSGVWAGFVPGVERGELYKYRIRSKIGDYEVDKTDPFAVRRELPPATASVVWDLDYAWGDSDWMATRAGRTGSSVPMSIYELHLGSWRRDPDAPERLPTYDEIGDALIPYLRQTGFTHVELLPPMEHPYYASWGYQVTGYFAATSRYGTPQDLMRLVDRLHQAGFGVVLDWVPSHFPSDEHGLGFFDGTRLYEYADPRLGYHPDWKSYIFNYGRNEVRSFLVSSAMFWIERYHVDAIRVDGVASMLYLDYSRPEGEWIRNKHGGRENLEAIAFLRQLNETIHERHPDVRTIAEESTAWPMVSRPPWVGGLGFDMKWDMGWMHDTLEYVALDPIFRKFHHEKLTFRTLYAWSENFVLPLSHDEVVHGKASLIGKMHGDYWQRFASLRALYGYMWTIPGKKLLFMGGEIGQWREWNHDAGLEWALLDYPAHAGLQSFVAELNRLYREEPALHALDHDPAGFAWIDCTDGDQSVIAYLRRALPAQGAAAARDVVAVCNFTPVPRHNYRIGLPSGGAWRERLQSDDDRFGGSGLGNPGQLEAVPMAYHGRPWSLCLTLAPLSILVLVPAGPGRPVPGAATDSGDG